MGSARFLVAAVAAALIGVGSAGAAYGQSGSLREREPMRVQVEGVDVEQVARLSAGVPLNFSVYGTPGASARVRIDGVSSLIELPETQPGIYEGTYVIAPQDRIRADSRVTATLLRGNVAAQAMLEESLQLGHDSGTVAPPEPMPRHASPPHAAAADAPEPVRSAPVPRSVPATAWPEAGRSTCATCGVVESIRVGSTAPGPGNLGAVSGAVIGAVLGEQAREAHMRRIARIHGTVTGALTGRGGDRAGEPRYEVQFRMPDGQTVRRSYAEAPAFQVGDRVSLDAAVATSEGQAPGRR
jgi:outer membrane lipoprotein SlyB